MSSQSTYELIESYLEGKLEGEVLEKFEQRLQSDQDFAEQFALFNQVDRVLEDKGALDFQKMVQEQGTLFLQKESSSETSEGKVLNIFSNRKNWLIAATLLFLVISSLVLWNNSNTNLSGPALYAQHFETYNLNQAVRSGAAEEGDFEKALNAFQKADYLQASQLLENLSKTKQSDMLLSFSLAQAYLNQKPAKFAAAKDALQKIIADGKSIYTPKAKWYLALILIHEESNVEAKKLLEDVAKSGDQFGAKAKTLLKEL